ncbi:transposase, partial [Sinorhizobium meliloti]
PDRIYVDKGYRGHDYTGSASVMIAGSRRGLTPTMRRELKRRSAIEPTIGHMKTDGRLDRNFLLGHDGDTVNALLVAAGHNLRLILAKLALWRAFIRAALTVLMAKSDTSPDRPTARRSMI